MLMFLHCLCCVLEGHGRQIATNPYIFLGFGGIQWESGSRGTPNDIEGEGGVRGRAPEAQQWQYIFEEKETIVVAFHMDLSSLMYIAIVVFHTVLSDALPHVLLGEAANWTC
jgi:hypothetical protein